VQVYVLCGEGCVGTWNWSGLTIIGGIPSSGGIGMSSYSFYHTVAFRKSQTQLNISFCSSQVTMISQAMYNNGDLLL
jgi:hypothetical protein